jgi:hypothetical protein
MAEQMSAIIPSSLSLASWTKEAFSITGGFSIGGGASVAPLQEETASVASKPIKYVHHPEETASVASRGQRSVHFKDERSISGRSLDTKRPKLPPRIMHSSQINYPRRPKRRGSNGAKIAARQLVAADGTTVPVSSVNLSDNDGMISLITTEGMNSIVEEGPLILEEFDQVMDEGKAPNEEFKESEPDPEPLPMKQKSRPHNHMTTADDASSSMLASVANQIVMSMGSWEAVSIACGPDSVATPASIEVPNRVPETMAVEIEGQEVQLVDMMDDQDLEGNNSIVDSRMPPHEKERYENEIDWPSRVGSCHSLIPDSLANNSFFSDRHPRGHNLSPACSMDMDVSSATDPFSCAGSIGGASLCKVFDGEASGNISRGTPSTPIHSRVLTQMPSWERNLRRESFLSTGSGDADDDSLFTKSSEKLMGGSISTIGSDNNDKSGASMAWENYNKE